MNQLVPLLLTQVWPEREPATIHVNPAAVSYIRPRDDLLGNHCVVVMKDGRELQITGGAGAVSAAMNRASAAPLEELLAAARSIVR